MGRYDLGLSEDEFWGLTLRGFNALAKRLIKKDEWLNYRAGMICSVVANSVRSKGAKVFTPEDFFPTTSTDKAQSWETILSKVTMLNAVFGGEVRLEDSHGD